MKFVAGNAQHIGARPQQQDAFGFSDPNDEKFVAHAGFLGVVADGMGGMTHGSEASRAAVLAFLDAYRRKLPDEPISKALARCLNEANQAVLRVAENVPSGDEVGTTLVAAVLRGKDLHWISAGDSRIYLLRGTNLTRLTADHVYARELNLQAAQGRISLAEAQNHPERGSLTSYLGQRELERVDKNVRPLAVQADDCLMLCSDGFYRALGEQEIVAGFRAGPQRACDTLLQQALAKHRKQQDNLTVIALRQMTAARPVSRKTLIAMAAVLLAALSAGIGYWYGRHFTTTHPVVKVVPQPPATPPTGSGATAGQIGGIGQGTSSSQNPTKPDKVTEKHGSKSATTKHAHATARPNKTVPTGSSTDTPVNPPADQPNKGAESPAPGTTQGTPQDKSSSGESGSQGPGNKTNPPQTPPANPPPANPPPPPQGVEKPGPPQFAARPSVGTRNKG